LVSLLLSRNCFFKISGIPSKILISLFSLKVIVGILYSYYFSLPSQIENADTWNYFIDSRIETDWLLNNPKAFFADLFTNHYATTGDFFTSSHSYWSDLKATFFTKLLAVLNVFSFKNYYINILFFNAFFMVGCVAFYKLIKENFTINKWLLIITIFLTPSFLFWCSAIHKDGLVFSSTAISLYIFYKILNNNISVKRVIILVACLVTIFALRNYYLLAIVPALVGWFLVSKFKMKSRLVFSILIAVCLGIFLFSTATNVTSGIGNSIVTKHNEFLSLDGNTKFKTPQLESNTKSIISYFPFALQASLFRPFILNTKSKAEFCISIENYFFIIILIFSIVFAAKKNSEILNNPIILTCFVISFFLLLFIGYTVCFDAAIIRYRSVSFPFLIVPSLVIIFGKMKNTKKL
jgi:hypothetical protein